MREIQRKAILYRVHILAPRKSLPDTAILQIEFNQGCNRDRTEARLFTVSGYPIATQNARYYLPFGFLAASEYELDSDSPAVFTFDSPLFIESYIMHKIPWDIRESEQKL